MHRKDSKDLENIYESSVASTIAMSKSCFASLRCRSFLSILPVVMTRASSALKSSLKTAKRLQLDWTKTAKDWTCSLGLSVLRLEDRKKTGCGGPVLLVETGLLYPYNYPSKRI